MKILSVILLLYIILLSYKPCCDEDGSISLNLKEQDAGNHDNTCNDICFPFFSCGTCTGFNNPPYSSSVEPVLVLLDAEKLFSYLPFDFEYIDHIWQPPKIC